MEKTVKTESFKLYFGQDDIRRVSLRCEQLADVVEQLHKLYSTNKLYHAELRIQYEDDEGGKITVSTQREWEEMWNTIGKERPYKLYIAEGAMQGKYFKDGPAPVIQYAYTKEPKEQTEQKVTGPVLDTISVAVPKGLERLFPGGKILPYNLPEWLRDSGAITLKHTDNPELVDLDIDVIKLLAVLNEQSLKYIGEDKTKEELEKGKEFLFSILTINPGSETALYNLACAESLQGNVEPALDALSKAIEAGYTNVDHMERDSDLNNIRNSDTYKQFVKKLRGEDKVIEVQPPVEIKPEVVEVKPEVVEVIEVKPEVKPVEPEIKKPEENVVPPVVQEVKPEVVEVKPEVVEVKPEEKKLPECRYPQYMETLCGMGFDASLCAFLLEEHRGDIQKVLDQLVQQTNV